MTRVTAADGTELHLRDWGRGRPVVLIHGWPLNGDAWEYQAVALAEAGYRVIIPDRRGFGRSGHPWQGYDYNTLADDLHAIMTALDLREATLAGFSMGGGEVARYLSRHGRDRVAQAILIASVVPMLLRTSDNPDGVPEQVFEDMKAGLRTDRPAFLTEFFKTFYGQGLISGVSEPVLNWSLSMALMASPKATLDCIDAFGKTDFRPDLPALSVPTLIVHGTADRTVPFALTAETAAAALPSARLIRYEGGAHGLPATHANQLLSDMLAFLREAGSESA